jgi:type II secretory ATPase GspE/PulE/Tfp pilus assembly ATPase PilB-like protein
VVARDNPPPQMLYPVLVRLMTMTNLSGCIKVHLKHGERRLHVTFKPTRYGLSALVEIDLDGSAAETCRARAAKLGYPFVDLERTQILPMILDLVPEQVAREHRVLPVSLDGDRLTVAMADPQTPDTMDRLRFTLNRPLSPAIAPEGAVLAAIERHYGPSDPEAADLMLWELAQPSEAPSDEESPPVRLPQPEKLPPDSVARPLAAELASVYREGIFELFGRLAAGPKLCRQAEGGDLEVVFSQAHLMSLLPAAARDYVEDKVWVLREAILSRLEHFLARDAVARGIAMSFALYQACCKLAAGEKVSINPATAREGWVNFLYAFITRHFPEIDSNGALLAFTKERLNELAGKLAAVAEDPEHVCDPAAARQWIARLDRQTSTEEGLDRDSPPVVRLVELLVAEAVHARASALALVPGEDRIEVAFRVQGAVCARPGLALGLLYPILARLHMLADWSGELRVPVGESDQALRLALASTPAGLAARLDLLPDRVAIARCRAEAAQHGHEFVELEEVEVPEALIRRIPKAVAWQKRVLPLALEDGTLRVAVSEPPSSRKLDELRLVFNRPVSVVMAPEADIVAAIGRHYRGPEPGVSAEAVSLLSK